MCFRARPDEIGLQDVGRYLKVLSSFLQFACYSKEEQERGFSVATATYNGLHQMCSHWSIIYKQLYSRVGFVAGRFMDTPNPTLILEFFLTGHVGVIVEGTMDFSSSFVRLEGSSASAGVLCQRP